MCNHKGQVGVPEGTQAPEDDCLNKYISNGIFKGWRGGRVGHQHSLSSSIIITLVTAQTSSYWHFITFVLLCVWGLKAILRFFFSFCSEYMTLLWHEGTRRDEAAKRSRGESLKQEVREKWDVLDKLARSDNIVIIHLSNHQPQTTSKAKAMNISRYAKFLE